MTDTIDNMVSHKLLFPYGTVIFGKNFPMVCTVEFDYKLGDGDNVKIAVQALTGVDEAGNIYDFEHLVANERSPITHFVYGAILGNETHWDWEPDPNIPSVTYWW